MEILNSEKKLNNMMAGGVTVLLVSHSINQVRRICDRCIWIDNGEIIMEGDVNEVCDAYVQDANYVRIRKEKKMKRKLRKKYG